MKRIALTGGIACGKSLIADFLHEFGIKTIDADDVVHELIPDPLERRRIAAEVFADADKRKELEARLHPLVRAKIREFMNACERRGETAIAIIPLLFEVHWDSEYDIICCVASNRETQVERMMTTRGYSREEAEARLAAQVPVDEKIARSSYVIRNDGSTGELREAVEAFVKWLG